MNRKIILGSIAAFIVIAAAVAVKMIWFPSVKDEWFATSSQRLGKVPAGKVIVRPTHFPGPKSNLLAFARHDGNQWMSGRNVTFSQLMASAYDYDPGRVSLPEGAPKSNFDFLFTGSGSREPLQAAVRKKTGYIARVEERETDVLALKVVDPSAPGIKVSGPDEKPGMAPKNGRLYLTHMPLDMVAEHMGELLKMPIVNKTGLNDFYNFSLVWDSKTQREIQGGNLDPETGKKILQEWGLGLEPDRASIEMLVVKKAN